MPGMWPTMPGTHWPYVATGCYGTISFTAGYGYGWYVAVMEGHRLRFRDGDNAGFSAANIQLPDDDALILLLSNVEVDPQEISLRLVGELLGGSTETSRLSPSFRSSPPCPPNTIPSPRRSAVRLPLQCGRRDRQTASSACMAARLRSAAGVSRR